MIFFFFLKKKNFQIQQHINRGRGICHWNVGALIFRITTDFKTEATGPRCTPYWMLDLVLCVHKIHTK